MSSVCWWRTWLPLEYKELVAAKLRRRSGAWTFVLLLAVVVVGAAVLWLLPAALVASVGMTPPERAKAMNDVRAPLVGFLVAVGAAGTLWFTARTYLLNREGQVTDRYTKAVGQLGDESSSVRIGSVYALERIGTDSTRDRVTVIYVLGAFIRERSKELRQRQDDPPEDVKAALRAVGRLLVSTDARLDLRDADLRNAYLADLPEDRVLLDGARLDGAQLPRRLVEGDLPARYPGIRQDEV